MARTAKIEGMQRMLRLLEVSAAGAMRVRDLAERFDVSAKTITRWADHLAAVHDTGTAEPVVRREVRRGEAWVVLGRPALALSPNLYNYAAVYLATRHLAALGELDLTESAHIVLEALGAAGAVRRDDLVGIQRAFHYVAFGPKRYDDADESIVATFFAAILRRRVVRARYRTRSGEARERRLEPYTLVVYRDGLYVVARQGDDGAGPISVFALDRFARAKATAEHFAPPADYAPDDYFADGLGMWRGGERERIRLAFDRDAAGVARERSWPGLREWTDLEDGRHVLELELRVTPEIKSWIASWGAAVEVLEPSTLRAEVAERLRQALTRYEA